MIDYAQARMQARHGAGPDARAWALLHASTTLGSLLDSVRNGALGYWVAGLDPGAGRAEAERLLNDRLRARIAEVARWMPQEWHPAVLRTATLLDLPARQQALRSSGDEERAALARREWIGAWRASWPPCSADQSAALEELMRALESHLARFAIAAPDDAEPLRLSLRARVESLFRRHALEPAAVFAHLLLVALEAERLRGEVMERFG